MDFKTKSLWRVPRSERQYIVYEVDAEGPAGRAGLEVGDVIIAVDGHDITGWRAYLYEPLTRVPEGTTIRLKLKRGSTIEVRAGQAEDVAVYL